MSQFPPPIQPGRLGFLKPHRGSTILVLGILSIVLCQILGIIAWVMGNADLREMDAGTMDPAGRESTNAGKVCGIIGTVLLGLGVCGTVAWILLTVVLVAGGAAGAAGRGP
ncbi:MAG: DUF4190 domain-containing protein [bacterium]|nr:DUF4190 domain-containing protein [bacterium]